MKYTFTKHKEIDNPTEITFSSEGITLDQILEDFQCFLLASGYCFNGQLIIEEIKNEEIDEI
jgi:hypothetical protein